MKLTDWSFPRLCDVTIRMDTGKPIHTLCICHLIGRDDSGKITVAIVEHCEQIAPHPAIDDVGTISQIPIMDVRLLPPGTDPSEASRVPSDSPPSPGPARSDPATPAQGTPDGPDQA